MKGESHEDQACITQVLDAESHEDQVYAQHFLESENNAPENNMHGAKWRADLRTDEKRAPENDRGTETANCMQKGYEAGTLSPVYTPNWNRHVR